MGQVWSTFLKVLRVCRNPVYHERPDLASHSRNARVSSRTVFALHGTASQPDMWASLKPPRPISTYSLVRYSIERCDPSSVSSLLVCECFLECERGFQNQLFLRSASESHKQSSLMAMKSAKLNVRYERPLNRAVSISRKSEQHAFFSNHIDANSKEQVMRIYKNLFNLLFFKKMYGDQCREFVRGYWDLKSWVPVSFFSSVYVLALHGQEHRLYLPWYVVIL